MRRTDRTHVLIVDDEPEIRALLEVYLRDDGHHLSMASTGEECLAAVTADPPDAIVLDIRMARQSGLEVLRTLREDGWHVPVILMTAHGTMQTAIEAMREGAFDYITKPFDETQLRRAVLAAVEASRHMRAAVLAPPDERPEWMASADSIVGSTPEMVALCKTIGLAARSDATVLITGESGTGKELVARAIYSNSTRASRFFLAVNCAALPDTLIESELFGHERGSFTGAENRRIGRFEQCDGGTLFLDEVGDLSLSAQAKVLRVLQEGTFERVGGTTPIDVDVRVIAATNRNLEEMVEASDFRKDLYYRLHVVNLAIPPLRARRQDIPLLAQYFVSRYGRELAPPVTSLPAEVLVRLRQYDWPGNVRELENCIETVVATSRGGVITVEQVDAVLGTRGRGRPGAMSTEEQLEDAIRRLLDEAEHPDGLYAAVMEAVERVLVRHVMEQTGGNQVQAAERLGIGRNKLRDRLVRYMPIEAGTANGSDRGVDEETAGEVL